MLAITATDTLTLVDPATLKRAPSSVPPCITLIAKPTASVWAPDNTILFLSSSQNIHKYESISNSLGIIYSSPGPDSISHLVAKDKANLIFSEGHRIHVLECGTNSGTAKVAQTFESHKATITSLSLSNDSTLLASTSAGAAHVYNLSLGSHTVLRGLPLSGQTISTCTFHPHSRTRLLLGIGKQLVVYDTTRPSGPIKVIPMADSTSGEINATACSPFSKTLVAVSTSGGNVGLIDLDKEKGLFRTLNLRVPLSSIAFSPEGAAIYLGTENGKLLIMDLRALDKPPKTIVISESGSRVETMNVQKKMKGSADPSTKSTTAATTTTTTKLSTQQDTANLVRHPSGNAGAQVVKSLPRAVPSPRKRAQLGSGPLASASPARRITSTLKGGSGINSPKPRTILASTEKPKKVFSPVRDPLGNSGKGDISVEIDSLSAMRGGLKKGGTSKGSEDVKTSSSLVSRTRLSSSPRAPSISAASAKSARAGGDSEASRRPRTLPTASRTRTSSVTDSGVATVVAQLAVPGDDVPRVKGRPRAASSASRAGSETASVISGRSGTSGSSRLSARSAAESKSGSRPSSSASRSGSSVSRAGSSSPIPPVPVLPAGYKSKQQRENSSRTPSPDLPDMNTDPVTPVAAGKKRMGAGIGVLGLGTPEVDRWIAAGKGKEARDKGKGKGKTVGFKDDSGDEDASSGEDNAEHEKEKEKERERSMTIQISPRRPAQGSNSWAPSPIRHPIPASPAGGSAHDLLRTIVRDVMYDFQRETKAEMTGLHLDLVRMGRGWKRELRDLMGEYVGDLRDLREENRVLREENERLRRGY